MMAVIGYNCEPVFRFMDAIGVSRDVPVTAIDIRIRPDEIITATVEIVVDEGAILALEDIGLLTMASIVRGRRLRRLDRRG